MENNKKGKRILLFGMLNLLISVLFINDNFQLFLFFFIIFSICFFCERKIVVQVLGKPIIKEISKLHKIKEKLEFEVRNLELSKKEITEYIKNNHKVLSEIEKYKENINQLIENENKIRVEIIKMEEKKYRLEQITKHENIVSRAIRGEEKTLDILLNKNDTLKIEKEKLQKELEILNSIIKPEKEKINFINECNFRLIDNFEGFEFEEFCAKLLKFNGYENIIITQKSVDYGIDIIAEKDKVKYAIQCKRYNGKVGNDAIQEAMTGKDYYGCNVAVVLTNSKFTHNAQKLANATGIILWDRDVLRNMIEKNKIKTLT